MFIDFELNQKTPSHNIDQVRIYHYLLPKMAIQLQKYPQTGVRLMFFDLQPGVFYMSAIFNPLSQLAEELSLSHSSIAATLRLLDEGNTVPFIARYRKEATGDLDELQIRAIQERRKYIMEMEERRATILSSIESQGKLSEDLRAQINACDTKNGLEDIYLPYKPKRRTRAMIACEKGLEPLAELILSQPMQGAPSTAAAAYIDLSKGVEDIEAALSGARDIAAERIAEQADIRAMVREIFAHEGVIVSKVIEGQDGKATKYEQYYAYSENVSTIPSHRYLAIRRGEKEGVLHFHIAVDAENACTCITKLAGLQTASPFAQQLTLAIEDAYARLIAPVIETDLRVELKMRSDRAAVDVFASNLRELLMAAPLGGQTIIGIDPGLRTGCKCAVVDATGKFLDNTTFNLVQGERAQQSAAHDLKLMIAKYHPYAIAIGNGTAGRETYAFVKETLKALTIEPPLVMMVSESGASVYSASDIAREEFPDLDLTVRGAISIARRLQDPLAELVKVDPKAIGVGQYQHDVYQTLLQEKLDEVVESCVNQVGVEINTASAPLLAQVAGIGPSLANKIIMHRDIHGAFRQRHELLDVSGLGPRTFEQAAGFLRIRNGKHPLDASAVHPERYALVEKMAKDLGVDVSQLIANRQLIESIAIKNYSNAEVGELTLRDIIAELLKPGRDPRAVFEAVPFRDDVSSMADLKPGMKLTGIVTNVAAFGAFVDIGVHQDGLIHISELSDRFIREASEVVKVGDKIKVEVLTVDAERKRISLTARSARQPSEQTAKSHAVPPKERGRERQREKPAKSFSNNPFSAL